jgi:TolB protein
VYHLTWSGDSLRRLTKNEEGNFASTVSPDGRRVAFASSRDQNLEIYRMKPDGSEQERLTHFFRDDWRPRWSPDGGAIAFLSDREGKDRIFLMEASGDRQRRLNADTTGGAVVQATRSDTARSDTSAYDWQEAGHVWSPSGEAIAYVRKRPRGPSQVWVAEVTSGRRRRLSPADSVADAPTWSPGGKYLAYAEGRQGAADLYLVRADGTGRTRLTDAPGDDWLPRWLPAAPPSADADTFDKRSTPRVE